MQQYDIFYYILISILAVIFIKHIISLFTNKNKINYYINKYFREERLYTLKEVASVFRLEEEHFLKLIKTLENYNYFPFFKKAGVTMVKDYYSKYELKTLIKILVKKNKLKA